MITNFKSNKDTEKYADAMMQLKVICPHCGKKATIIHGIDRVVCHWCKHYVYKNKQVEFRYKVLEKIIKERRNFK